MSRAGGGGKATGERTAAASSSLPEREGPESSSAVVEFAHGNSFSFSPV